MREDGPPMLFSSLVFLWIFLPVVLVAYRLVPGWGKNALLLSMADSLLSHEGAILAENEADMSDARGHISDVMLDRCTSF